MITPAPTQFNSTSNSELTPSSFLSDLAQQIAAGRKGIAGSDDSEKCVTDTSASFNLCPNMLIPPQQQQTSSTAMATTATTQGQQGDNSNFQQTVVNTSSWNASQQANAHYEQHMNQLMNSVFTFFHAFPLIILTCLLIYVVINSHSKKEKMS